MSKKEIDKCLDKEPFQRYVTKQKDTSKYHKLIKDEISACFNILNSDNLNRQYHALLMMYKIIEYVCDVFYSNNQVVDNRFVVNFYYPENEKWYKQGDSIQNRMVEGHSKPIVDERDLFSTKNKCFNIAKYVWPSTDQSSMIGLFDAIDDLSINRNSYVHVKGTNLPSITHKQLILWMKAIETIIRIL